MAIFVERDVPMDDNEAGITRLVEGLFSLMDGELSIAALAGMGQRAVPALRRALLEGRPSTIYLPRQRMVRALSDMGAFEVLREYLLLPKAIADPVLRLAEEAVENTAARELGRDRSDENFELLVAVASGRKLPGSVEAIAQFQRAEAAPALVAALESDFCRTAAIDGIRQIAQAAIPHLIESVRCPEPSRREESPTSLRRRRAAARLLAEQEPNTSTRAALEFLLYESDEWLQCCGAQLAFSGDQTRVALPVLLAHVGSDDWVLVDEITDVLTKHLPTVRESISRELERGGVRTSLQDSKRSRRLRWILQSQASLKHGEHRIA